jgi:hypothetical protein
MDIQLLSQQAADALMKSLAGASLSHFLYAFHAERNHPREQCWALPPGKRLYYRVESYLFGVNRREGEETAALCLSSLARIDPAHPHGTCAMCLKFLIEKALVPLGRTLHKTRILAALNRDSTRVFHELQSLLPGVQLVPGDRFGVIDLEERGRLPFR